MKKIIIITLFALFLLISCSENEQNETPHTIQSPPVTESENKETTQTPAVPVAKDITITLPEDYSNQPYKAAELIPPSEFEWGEYMPLVAYTNYSLDDTIPAFALLGNGVNTLDEGQALYKKLNSLYLTRYPMPEEGDVFGIPLSDRDIADYFYASNIIKTNEDLEKVEVWRVVDWDKESCHGELDTYENGKLVDTQSYESWHYTAYAMGRYYDDTKSNSTGVTAYRYYNHHNNEYTFKVSKDEVTLYNLTFDIGKTYIPCIDQVIDDTHLLITFKHLGWLEDDFVYDPYSPDNGINRNTYLADLESETLTKVENYVGHPSLSPDREYLVYFSYHDTNSSANPDGNWAYKIERGVYIKRLSTGETTFLPFYSSWSTSHQVLSWVSREAYDKAVN